MKIFPFCFSFWILTFSLLISHKASAACESEELAAEKELPLIDLLMTVEELVAAESKNEKGKGIAGKSKKIRLKGLSDESGAVDTVSFVCSDTSLVVKWKGMAESSVEANLTNEGIERVFKVEVMDFYGQGCQAFVDSLKSSGIKKGDIIQVYFAGPQRFPGLLMGRPAPAALQAFVVSGSPRAAFLEVKKSND